MKPISQIIKEGEEEFDKKIPLSDFIWEGGDASEGKFHEKNILKIKDFNRTQAKAILQGVIEMIESMKCDERKTKDFGDFVAETYEEKMSINQALTQVIEKLKEEISNL